MSSDRDPVRIRFEFSAADLADLARRSADRSKTVRDQRWHAAASWSALLALVLFFALDGSFIARAAFSIPFGLAVFYWCTGGLLAVRNRAFQTSELRSDFLRKSRQFLAESTRKHQSQTHNT